MMPSRSLEKIIMNNNDQYNSLTPTRQKYVDAIRSNGPDCGIDTNKTEYSRAELRQVSMKIKGKVWIPNWITHDQSRRVGRGVFSIPEVPVVVSDTESSVTASSADTLAMA